MVIYGLVVLAALVANLAMSYYLADDVERVRREVERLRRQGGKGRE